MRFSRTLTVVGCHAEGEVGNVVTGGIGDVPGRTMFDKRLYLERERDDLRRLLLFEPRGAAVQSANIVLPSSDPAAAMGYVILESTEYPAMSGSNTMCVATVLLETGMVAMVEPVTELVLEAPGGLIRLVCECRDGKVTRVRLTNRPAFVHHLDARVEVAGMGTLTVDVAYGGMTYALVDAAALGYALTPDEARDLCEAGERIKRAAAEQLVCVHPTNPLIAGITMTEFTGPLREENGTLAARNTVIVSPGRCDRSPCGTGTSARLAVMHARGQLGVGRRFVHESILGTRFEASIVDVTSEGGVPAVVPEIAGQAWITGVSQLGLDPTDPFPRGYTMSDSWMSTVG